MLESISASIADGSIALQGVISGAEDVLLGDETTDVIASAAGDAVAGFVEVADSIVVAVAKQKPTLFFFAVDAITVAIVVLFPLYVLYISRFG